MKAEASTHVAQSKQSTSRRSFLIGASEVLRYYAEWIAN